MRFFISTSLTRPLFCFGNIYFHRRLLRSKVLRKYYSTNDKSQFNAESFSFLLRGIRLRRMTRQTDIAMSYRVPFSVGRKYPVVSRPDRNLIRNAFPFREGLRESDKLRRPLQFRTEELVDFIDIIHRVGFVTLACAAHREFPRIRRPDFSPPRKARLFPAWTSGYRPVRG